jgi:imidazolonepropionase-like amidohydrolase
MKRIVLRGARVFDGDRPELADGVTVVVQGATIAEVTDAPVETGPEDEIIECGGRVLMPGLIDAHVHVYAAGLNVTRLAETPATYLAHFAAQFLQSSLKRGFTTVRDVGGADVGLANAIRDGLLKDVPRLIYGGRVLTQTGGHGDFREGHLRLDHLSCCGCEASSNQISVVADGADAVRKAVREELRRGAAHIKIMASGGVASPTDPLDRCQYSDEEIRAAVDETDRAGKYVVAHCHPAQAVRRAAELGVRSIEHATLVDERTAEFVAERGAYAVPTMATIVSLAEEGKRLGLPPASLDKLERVRDSAFQSLEILHRAGVKIGLGTDLLGALHVQQSREFALRAEMLPAREILRQTCAINAELMGMSGTLGCVKSGATADLVVVEGNPLEDISVLARGGEGMAIVIQGGSVVKKCENASSDQIQRTT